MLYPSWATEEDGSDGGKRCLPLPSLVDLHSPRARNAYIPNAASQIITTSLGATNELEHCTWSREGSHGIHREPGMSSWDVGSGMNRVPVSCPTQGKVQIPTPPIYQNSFQAPSSAQTQLWSQGKVHNNHIQGHTSAASCLLKFSDCDHH